MEVNTCNLSIQEVGARGLHFQVNLGYIVALCFEKIRKKAGHQ
jgi:hypothetical protein